MTSRREQVIEAVKALVVGALPNAEVKRNLAKPERIAPGGLRVYRKASRLRLLPHSVERSQSRFPFQPPP